MSGEPENIVLVYLRRLDAKMDRVIEEVQDVKQRLSALQIGQARLRQDVAELYSSYAGVIERRLDLVEPPL